MNMTSNVLELLRALACAALVVAASPALAHEGEDHSAPATVIGQSLLPRAAAASDEFELVAILEVDRLLVYLDRAASNEPVLAAKLEIEGAGLNAVAEESAPGVYALALAKPLGAGRHALTFTIQTDQSADLLTATLEVAAPAAAAAAPAASSFLQALPGSLGPWLGGSAVLVAAGLTLAALRRRRRASAL